MAVALQRLQLKLALVESCTGGGLAYQLTEVSGGSNWFDRGWVTYSNAAKIELGVNPETLERFGAVSPETAIEMAKCAIKHSVADISLSITGIAGPTGGTPAKPVGLVYFAMANRQGFCQSQLKHFTSGRHQIRVDSVNFAIHWLLEYLNNQ